MGRTSKQGREKCYLKTRLAFEVEFFKEKLMERRRYCRGEKRIWSVNCTQNPQTDLSEKFFLQPTFSVDF